MGKTALAMNIAQDIVFKQKKKVGFFSLEMSSQSIALRMLSSLSTVEFSKIRTGDYESSNDDTRAVTQAIDMMQDCSLYIDDTGSITPMTLRSRALERSVMGVMLPVSSMYNEQSCIISMACVTALVSSLDDS